MQVRLDAKVTTITKMPLKNNSGMPQVSVKVNDSEILEADLVIIANGRNSKLREVLYDDPMNIVSRTVLFRYFFHQL
jgi:2-polyprenyl-6-methoxyphenol hydroxylase-like FAD-dependent oxidoreductase